MFAGPSSNPATEQWNRTCLRPFRRARRRYEEEAHRMLHFSFLLEGITLATVTVVSVLMYALGAGVLLS
jgi:hypothetical protein